MHKILLISVLLSPIVCGGVRPKLPGQTPLGHDSPCFFAVRGSGRRLVGFSCTAAHIFVSPGDAPANIAQYVAGMERQFNACQTPRSMYLSIVNNFRVIRCLSQCVRRTDSA